MRAPHQPGQRRAWSAFALIAGVVLLALFASATPSPLYADYAARWHFSTPMLTIVFATYALGALTALLLAGRLSDDLGRRPLLTAGLAGLLGAMLLYAFARSVEWPLAARLVQGVATGIILSTAGAALLELEPGRDTGRAGLVNGVSAALGIGTRALVSSLLVQDAPDPRVTPFALLCAPCRCGRWCGRASRAHGPCGTHRASVRSAPLCQPRFEAPLRSPAREWSHPGRSPASTSPSRRRSHRSSCTPVVTLPAASPCSRPGSPLDWVRSHSAASPRAKRPRRELWCSPPEWRSPSPRSPLIRAHSSSSVR